MKLVIATKDSAGYDIIYEGPSAWLYPQTSIKFPVGPNNSVPGYWGKIEAKSGPTEYQVFPIGGVIDGDYPGDVKVNLYNGGKEPFYVQHGKAVAQIVYHKKCQPVPGIVPQDVVRTGGFGSTGV